MNVAKQSDGCWWILGVPPYLADGEVFSSCGPYTTRAEAEDDRRGLERFFRENPPECELEVTSISIEGR